MSGVGVLYYLVMGGLLLTLVIFLPVKIIVRILKSRPKAAPHPAGPVFCRRCGTPSDGFHDLCMECGEVLEEIVETKWAGERPPAYLAYAILTTIFCCVPFGIVALVYAAQVNSYWENGQFEKAEDLSHKAKTWCWVAAICGIVLSGLYTIFMLISMAGPRFMFGI